MRVASVVGLIGAAALSACHASGREGRSVDAAAPDNRPTAAEFFGNSSAVQTPDAQNQIDDLKRQQQATGQEIENLKARLAHDEGRIGDVDLDAAAAHRRANEAFNKPG